MMGEANPGATPSDAVSAAPSVSDAIRAALLTADPRAKLMAARKIARDWRLGRLAFSFDTPMPDRPARPAAPELLPPNRMPKRGRGQSHRARIALWHALAHIEFVAIDLALDMAGRFGAEMGAGFLGDFLKVAADEALHFALLDRHLRAMGSHYGALPAHDGLWQAAEGTRHDVAARVREVGQRDSWIDGRRVERRGFEELDVDRLGGDDDEERQDQHRQEAQSSRHR